ncbi:MAG: hypothetical protein M1836_004919 [Candelina mexicana]|nr:MAG: hypothetical protein M1836_004919 [Candelina mexicana]
MPPKVLKKESVRVARKKEAQAFEEALAAIPQKYRELHLRGLLHHRVLKMLRAWIADLKLADDTPIIESFNADNGNASKDATVSVSPGAIIDDSDEDMTITDDETAAAEALEGGQITEEEEEEDTEDDKKVGGPPTTSSKVRKSKTSKTRPVEAAEFATTLETIPAKYKNVKPKCLIHHRVILMLREWIADLIAEKEREEKAAIADAQLEEEVRILSKVDGASEVYRLRVANDLLLEKLLKLSQGLEGIDDKTSKDARVGIDQTIRKAWLCMTYDSTQEKETMDDEQAA